MYMYICKYIYTHYIYTYICTSPTRPSCAPKDVSNASSPMTSKLAACSGLDRSIGSPVTADPVEDNALC